VHSAAPRRRFRARAQGPGYANDLIEGALAELKASSLSRDDVEKIAAGQYPWRQRRGLSAPLDQGLIVTEIKRDDRLIFLLAEDVEAAKARLKEKDTPTHRREVVRSTFSAIEGFTWQMKQCILFHAKRFSDLSIHEEAALLEESYAVDDRGEVTTYPRYLSPPVAIRLMVRMTQPFRSQYTDERKMMANEGWSHLKEAMLIRNRIVHPKIESDLDLTDDELSKCANAMAWAMTVALVVMRDCVLDVRKRASKDADA
jgi:hypothetical protein